MQKKITRLAIGAAIVLVLCYLAAATYGLTVGFAVDREVTLSRVAGGQQTADRTELLELHGKLRYNLFTLRPVAYEGKAVVYGRYVPQEQPVWLLAGFRSGGTGVIMVDDAAFPYDPVFCWSGNGRLLFFDKGKTDPAQDAITVTKALPRSAALAIWG